MRLDLERLQELHLADLRGVGTAAAGVTERGPFRLEAHAPGIVRLTIGSRTLPDYGLVTASPELCGAQLTPVPDGLLLVAGPLRATIVAEGFQATLARNGTMLLGPPKDAHFRRRYRLPRFAATEKGFLLAVDLAEGEPVHGHGEKWSRLDHRGQWLVSWSQDVLGVNAEASYKNRPFAWSPRGWGLFVNTPGRVSHGIGFAPLSHRSYALEVEDECLDLFLIAAEDPAGILERFTWLAGRPGAVPRWSLGAWLSRAYCHDAGEFLGAAAKVRELALPMDVITLDGRAWQDMRTRFAFQWDPRRCPEPEAVLGRARELGFRVCCWEYPLVSAHNPAFTELAARGFFLTDERAGDPWLHEWDPAPFGDVLTPLPTSGIIGFARPEAWAWWRDRHAALFAAGVDVIKCDFGEQIPDSPHCRAWNGDRRPRLHNVYALLYNACVHEARERFLGQGLAFARAGWAGSQRYPVPWGGDPQADWDGLAASIRSMLSWSCSGNPWYATGIGGFYGGPPEPLLFVRWCQAAVFASHMRFHELGSREPWLFGEEAQNLARAALELRYALIPYIERSLALICATGVPLCRPMLLAFPEAREAHAFDTQYLLGPDLLVVPVLAPDGEATVWLPDGAWWDWHGLERHVGPKRLSLALPPGRFPLFAREGAKIPLAIPVQRTAEWDDGAVPLAAVRRFA